MDSQTLVKDTFDELVYNGSLSNQSFFAQYIRDCQISILNILILGLEDAYNTSPTFKNNLSNAVFFSNGGPLPINTSDDIYGKNSVSGLGLWIEAFRVFTTNVFRSEYAEIANEINDVILPSVFKILQVEYFLKRKFVTGENIVNYIGRSWIDIFEYLDPNEFMELGPQPVNYLSNAKSTIVRTLEDVIKHIDNPNNLVLEVISKYIDSYSSIVEIRLNNEIKKILEEEFSAKSGLLAGEDERILFTAKYPEGMYEIYKTLDVLLLRGLDSEYGFLASIRDIKEEFRPFTEQEINSYKNRKLEYTRKRYWEQGVMDRVAITELLKNVRNVPYVEGSTFTPFNIVSRSKSLHSIVLDTLEGKYKIVGISKEFTLQYLEKQLFDSYIQRFRTNLISNIPLELTKQSINLSLIQEEPILKFVQEYIQNALTTDELVYIVTRYEFRRMKLCVDLCNILIEWHYNCKKTFPTDTEIDAFLSQLFYFCNDRLDFTLPIGSLAHIYITYNTNIPGGLEDEKMVRVAQTIFKYCLLYRRNEITAEKITRAHWRLRNLFSMRDLYRPIVVMFMTILQFMDTKFSWFRKIQEESKIFFVESVCEKLLSYS